MLVWLLCSLITVLVMIQIERKKAGKEPNEYTGDDWFWIVIFAVAFPLYYGIQIVGNLPKWSEKFGKATFSNFLTKPINFKRR